MARSGTPAPASQSSVRAHNLALALGVVARADRPVSRADIASATGMTRATASSLADELLSSGFLDEIEPVREARAGRPAAGLVLATTGPAALGLEISVDHLGACLLDLSGEVRHRVVVTTDVRTLTTEQAVGRLGELAASTVSAGRRRGLRALGAAVAVPGLVDTRGMLRLAPNLGWRDIDLPAALARRRSLRSLAITVHNEADAAATEHAAVGRDRDFLFVSGEIGIGAAIMAGGQLLAGRRGWAGELGHVPVWPDGPVCSCGARGCLETYAGLDAIRRQAGLTTAATRESAYAIVESAYAGHEPTLVALLRAGEALGIAISGALNLLDISTVVLGGSYGRLVEWIGQPMERELRQRVLAGAWEPVVVQPARAGTDAALCGAARFVLQRVLADPSEMGQDQSRARHSPLVPTRPAGSRV